MHLKEEFEALNLVSPVVKDEEWSQFQKHFDLLCSWNERMSLVSPNSLKTALATHYLDSLCIADFAREHLPRNEVSDLGTGAGFPGLIFAIRYPEIPITLYEKSLKKQSFLGVAISQLGLGNVSLSGALLEGRKVGLMLARAVMPPDKLFPFLKKHLWPGSVAIMNYGGSRQVPTVPNYFEKTNETRYSLPLNCGDRVAQALTLK